jgi:uncharacterized membrane protein YecN with MAPEG domain
MVFSVTPIYALALVPIFLVLWIRVSSMRAASGVSFGDGGNPVLLHRMRQHGNFIEWVPIVLILMILAEGMGAPAIYPHLSGVLLVIGRLAHPFGLKPDNAGHPLRYLGNGSNLLAVLVASAGIAASLFGL